MFGRIARAFRPLDTTEVDAAIATAAKAHRDVHVRARALRMDVSCADPVAAIAALTRKVIPLGGAVTFAKVFAVTEPTPADMKDMLGKM